MPDKGHLHVDSVSFRDQVPCINVTIILHVLMNYV